MRHILFGFTMLCAAALSAAPTPADVPTMPANTWVTGRAVRAVVRVGDRLFVGGAFPSVYPRARYTGSLAVFSHGVENAVTLPALSGGVVTALANDDAGGWFAAGTFTHAGNVALDITAAPRLVHLRSDGTVRQISAQGMSGTGALALVRSDRTLMLAYVRTVYSGRLVFNDYFIAAFDAVTGERRAPDIVVAGLITSLVADHTRIYVFGYFSAIGGEPRSGAAAFDASSLMLVTWAPAVFGVTNAEIDGTSVYLAGDFTTVAGQPRQGLAAVSTTDGTLLSWTPSFDCAANGLAAGPDAVYVAGCSSSLTQGLVTAFDKTTGAALTWSVTADGPVRAIDVSGSHLYVAGRFGSMAGEPRLNAASFRNRVLDSWNPRPSDEVSVAFATPDHISLAGRLTGLGAVPVGSPLLEFDARTGALSSWVAPAIRGEINSLSSDGRWLFVRSGAASSCPPNYFLPDCAFLAIALVGNTVIELPVEAETTAATRDRVYVAGAFGLIGFDTNTGALLPWRVPMHIRKIFATDSAVYAVPYESFSAERVLKIDARSGRVLPWGPVITTYGIGQLALTGSWLLIGIASSGLPDSSLIVVDQGTGAVLAKAPPTLVPSIDVYPAGPSFSALLNPPPWFPVTGGLAASGRGVVFSSNGTLRVLNPATGALLPWSLNLDGPVQTLYADDSVMVAGGDFAHVEGIASPGLAIIPERVPSAPLNLNAFVSGHDVRFQWTPPTDGNPSDYRLEAGTRSGISDLGSWILPLTASLNVTDVPNGRYYVRVRAASAAGLGPSSNEVEVVVGPADPD